MKVQTSICLDLDILNQIVNLGVNKSKFVNSILKSYFEKQKGGEVENPNNC